MLPQKPTPQGNGQMQGGSLNNESMLNRASSTGVEGPPGSLPRSMNHQPNGNGPPSAATRPHPQSFGASLGAPPRAAPGPKPSYPQDFQRRPVTSGGPASRPSSNGPPPQNGNPYADALRQAPQPQRGPPGPNLPPQPTAGGPPPQMAPQEEMRMNPMPQAVAANRPPPQPHVQQPPPSQQQPPRPYHPSQGPLGPATAAAANPPTPQGPPGGMRELRVEDALIYLDDVKREFGDRPRIYNEFLEIMKNFKSQEVDTPGVIDRVSRLFRGYNKLILGFNKFLPDGYKISLQDLERQDAERAARERQLAAQQNGAQAQVSYFPGQSRGPGQQSQSAHLQEAGGMPGPSGSSPTQAYQKRPAGPPQAHPQGAQVGRPAGHPAQGVPPPMQQAQQQQQPMGQHIPPRQPPQPLQQQQQQHQAVEFDHAISYVTNIKKRFANDPGTYHAFLEILHTYQKEQRGIKEVLEQVAALFADHPDLLKEFTFFLPDAVQEQAKERLHRAAAESESRMAAQRAGGDNGMFDAGSRHIMSPGYGGMRVETGRLALQQAQASAGGQKFIDMTGQVS